MKLEDTSRIVGNIKVLLAEGIYLGKFAQAVAEAATWADAFQKSIDATRAVNEQGTSDNRNQPEQDPAGVGGVNPDDPGRQDSQGGAV